MASDIEDVNHLGPNKWQGSQTSTLKERVSDLQVGLSLDFYRPRELTN